MRLALFASLCACSAGTALNRLPRAQIDRPYTLPAGVDDWSVAASTVASRDDSGASGSTGSLVVNWGIALSDDWELTLGLDPAIGIRHQFLHDDLQRLGMSLSVSSGFSVQGGTDMPTTVDAKFEPLLHVDELIRLSRRWSWGIGADVEASRWTYQPRWDWHAQLTTGPVWQATDVLALEAFVSAGSSHYSYGDRPYAGALIGGAWSLARQWELALRVGTSRVSNANGYRELNGSLTLVNFW